MNPAKVDLKECSRCGDSYEEVIKASGHTFVTETKEAACQEEGYVKTTCENCDYENIERVWTTQTKKCTECAAIIIIPELHLCSRAGLDLPEEQLVNIF